jgi:hypothetical protein
MPTRQALLVAQILVSGQQSVEARRLRLTQEFAVLKLAPTELVRSGDFMLDQVRSQRNRCALVEKDAHLRNLQRLGSVLQNDARLLSGDARKPAHEIG